MDIQASVRKALDGFGRSNLQWQGLRFLLVGAMNTLVGYALFLIGLSAGLTPEVALGLATTIGAVFNYFSTGRIVFSYRSPDRMIRFLAVYLAIYVLNAACLRAAIWLGASPAVAQGVLLPLVAITSFLTFRRYVFSRS